MNPVPDEASSRAERAWIAGVFFFMLLAYMSNGREIGSYDSRPSELAAREFLLRGTLSLNHPVGATPQYATRWGFVLAQDGRYRGIYSPVPSIAAAGLVWPFWKLRLVDIRAPLAPQWIGKTTAATLVALAVAIAYSTARRTLPRSRALLLAVGLGLGTGLWSSASQTLWQSETAVLGFAVAVAAFVRASAPSVNAALAFGAGLALAGTARPQLAPAIALLLAGAWYCWPLRRTLVAGSIVAAASLALVFFNLRWFGHPFGAIPLITDLNADVHGTGASFQLSFEGLAGLLVSPSRGLLVFSPVVLVAAAGIGHAVRRGRTGPELWCLCAAFSQLLLYGSYSVWWGGHTYGPRYLLDILPLLVPLAASAMAGWRSKVWAAAASAALCWSIVVAATGTFCYPHDAWNTDPTEIDRDHARLWWVADSQIPRCWNAGPSPQNFSLFARAP